MSNSLRSGVRQHFCVISSHWNFARMLKIQHGPGATYTSYTIFIVTICFVVMEIHQWIMRVDRLYSALTVKGMIIVLNAGLFFFNCYTYCT